MLPKTAKDTKDSQSRLDFFLMSSAKPTCFHMLAAKHVLHYLGGTKLLALSLGAPSPTVPKLLHGHMQNMGCSNADWASDALDHKSISGCWIISSMGSSTMRS